MPTQAWAWYRAGLAENAVVFRSKSAFEIIFTLKQSRRQVRKGVFSIGKKGCFRAKKRRTGRYNTLFCEGYEGYEEICCLWVGKRLCFWFSISADSGGKDKVEIRARERLWRFWVQQKLTPASKVQRDRDINLKTYVFVVVWDF